MSKRPTSTSSLPAKMLRGEDDNQSQVFSVRVEGDGPETLTVYTGSRTRVSQTYVLTDTPFERIEVTVSLDECFPALRFTNRFSQFFMTGREFCSWDVRLKEWSTVPMTICDRLHSEPADFGSLRLFRESDEESFTLPKCALDVLKVKAKYIANHIEKIVDAESVILLMFDCIDEAYRHQHRLSGARDVIQNDFDEVTRLLECYTPMSRLVNHFNARLLKKGWLCEFNPYNICSLALTQKKYILANM